MFPRSWTSFTLLLTATVTTMACSHSIDIEPDEVAELASYHTEGSVTLEDDSQSVEVTPEDQPKLRLRLDVSCSFRDYLRNRCDKVVEGDLEDATFDEQGLSLDVRTSLLPSRHRRVEAQYESIERAELRLENYRSDHWRPRGGFGLTVMGPSAGFAVHGQYFPTEMLALEFGTLPGGPLIGLYSALRLRAPVTKRVHPFVGTFINFLAGVDVEDGTTESVSGTGVRLGVDIHLLSTRRWLLTVEGTLVHPLNEDREYFYDVTGDLIPWGGVSTAVLF